LADYGADNKQIIGVEPDIARLIADGLGLKLVLVPVASGLAEPITQALNTQIASGTYAQALKRWNVGEEAVARSETNPPGLSAL
jgi:ABC-type amino acid transport substrate-binding protein